MIGLFLSEEASGAKAETMLRTEHNEILCFYVYNYDITILQSSPITM